MSRRRMIWRRPPGGMLTPQGKRRQAPRPSSLRDGSRRGTCLCCCKGRCASPSSGWCPMQALNMPQGREAMPQGVMPMPTPVMPTTHLRAGARRGQGPAGSHGRALRGAAGACGRRCADRSGHPRRRRQRRCRRGCGTDDGAAAAAQQRRDHKVQPIGWDQRLGLPFRALGCLPGQSHTRGDPNMGRHGYAAHHRWTLTWPPD